MKYMFRTPILIGMLVFLCCGEKAEDFDSTSRAGLEAMKDADYNEAILQFGKALHFKPSDRDMLYNMGVAFSRLGMTDSALVYIHRADVLHPTDRAINEELFRLCTAVKDYECALSAVQILVITGDSEEMFWIPLADLNFFQGKYRQSIKYYKLLINDNPGEGRYHWNLAESLARLNRPEEAIEVLMNAIDLLGINPVAYSQIAVNYITLRKYDKAEEYFRKAIELDPKNVSLWVNLANVLTEQDKREKKEEALQIYKRYLIDTPELFKLDSLIKALEKELGYK